MYHFLQLAWAWYYWATPSSDSYEIPIAISALDHRQLSCLTFRVIEGEKSINSKLPLHFESLERPEDEGFLVEAPLYVGETNDIGQKHGFGMHQTATAKTYGQFQNDLLQGCGKVVYKNRDTFIGHHLNGKREGSGFILNSKGQAYIGEWQDDKLIDHTLSAIKDNYIGEAKNGVKEGRGTMIYSDGSVYFGNWHDDRRSGKEK